MKNNYWTYAINLNPTDGSKFPYITIQPISYWLREECIADQYTDEEWDDITPFLDKLGLWEICESVFVADGYSACDGDLLEETLLKEGFVKSKSFEDFAKEYN